MTLDNLLSGLIGSVVGGGATLAASWYSFRLQRQLDADRHSQQLASAQQERRATALARIKARQRSLGLSNDGLMIEEDLYQLREALLEHYDLFCLTHQKNQDFIEQTGVRLKSHGGNNMSVLNSLKEMALTLELPQS